MEKSLVETSISKLKMNDFYNIFHLLNPKQNDSGSSHLSFLGVHCALGSFRIQREMPQICVYCGVSC